MPRKPLDPEHGSVPSVAQAIPHPTDGAIGACIQRPLATRGGVQPHGGIRDHAVAAEGLAQVGAVALAPGQHGPTDERRTLGERGSEERTEYRHLRPDRADRDL